MKILGRSVLASLLIDHIYGDNRSGIVTGLLGFSHWVIDFITHSIAHNVGLDLLHYPVALTISSL